MHAQAADGCVEARCRVCRAVEKGCGDDVCGSCRRWLERMNAKLREAGKKEEKRRLKDFVESAYRCDPRVAAHKEVQRAERCACTAYFGSHVGMLPESGLTRRATHCRGGKEPPTGAWPPLHQLPASLTLDTSYACIWVSIRSLS